MLFGDADIEEPVGKPGLERDQTRWTRHRRSDRDDARIGVGLFDDCLGERLRVPGGQELRWPDAGVEDRRVVQVLLVVVLCWWIAATLLGQDVDADRTLGRQFDSVTHRRLERLDVVTVDRTHVAHAERFEERRRLQEFAYGGFERFHALFGLLANDGEVTQEALDPSLTPHIRRVETDVGEPVAEFLRDPER